MKMSWKRILGKMPVVAVIVAVAWTAAPTATAATAKPPKPNIDLCIHNAGDSAMLRFPRSTAIGAPCIGTG